VEIARKADKNISLLHRCLHCKQSHSVQIDTETMQLQHKAANSPEILINACNTADWGHRTVTDKRNVQRGKLSKEQRGESLR
jgi:RNase P subunit RPR2